MNELPETPPVPFEPYICIPVETANGLEVWHRGGLV